jgi:hypothetical protein
MDPNSDFQKEMVEYLESVHVGEFMTGTMDEVKEQVDENMKAKEYKDPTQMLPDAPPEQTDCDCNKCESCESTANWWQTFKNTVDDLILRSNVHKCHTSIPAMRKSKKKSEEVASTSMETARHAFQDRLLRRLRLTLRQEHSISKKVKGGSTLSPQL